MKSQRSVQCSIAFSRVEKTPIGSHTVLSWGLTRPANQTTSMIHHFIKQGSREFCGFAATRASPARLRAIDATMPGWASFLSPNRRRTVFMDVARSRADLEVEIFEVFGHFFPHGRRTGHSRMRFRRALRPWHAGHISILPNVARRMMNATTSPSPSLNDIGIAGPAMRSMQGAIPAAAH
jgi:hypothetical protein